MFSLSLVLLVEVTEIGCADNIEMVFEMEREGFSLACESTVAGRNVPRCIHAELHMSSNWMPVHFTS